MGVFAQLARLRPMMPVERLQHAIGRDWRPPPGGWLSIGGAFSARVDVEEKIGLASFQDQFPGTLSINGVHIGMTLDDLMVNPLGFKLVTQRLYPFKLTDYFCVTADGDEFRARVDMQGLVRRVDITRPGSTYSEGKQFTEESSYTVSPWDYGDINEMVSDWAAGTTFSDNHDLLVGFGNWLMTKATPDDWHCAVEEWNWDDGIEPLLWIIRQRECDKATALTVFYLARPGQHVKYGGDRTKVPFYLIDQFDLRTEIRRRFLQGFYTRSSVAFDGPRAFRDDAYISEADDADAVSQEIPKSTRVKIAGRPVSEVGHRIRWEDWEHSPIRRSKLVPPPLSADEIQEIERITHASAQNRTRRP
jgi:Domain of unknown function (DUF4274)